LGSSTNSSSSSNSSSWLARIIMAAILDTKAIPFRSQLKLQNKQF
jgi:hypothetical protein